MSGDPVIHQPNLQGERHGRAQQAAKGCPQGLSGNYESTAALCTFERVRWTPPKRPQYLCPPARH
jgi:hypothetical protein